MHRFVLLSLLAVPLVACAGAPVRGSPEADRAAILKADGDFDADTAARGLEAWLSWFEATTTIWNKTELVHDREHYRKTMAGLLSKEGNALRWTPVWGEVSGDLGYTTGRWQLRQKGEGGKEAIAASGRYVTVWRRQADGGWKAIFDMGNDDK